MTFDADARSVQDSRPRDFVEATYGTTTIRTALGQRDIYYNGQKFAASVPAARGEIVVDSVTGNSTFQLSLANTHPLVTRFMAFGGTPPNKTLITLRQMQLRSGETRQIWIGYVTGLSFDRHEAKFLVPARTQQSVMRKLPTVLVGTTCPNVLYDTRCKVDRVANTFAAHVVSVDGRNVGVAFDVSQPAGSTWAIRGSFMHLASGEQMAIMDQASGGLDFVLQSPIFGMAVGDHVTLTRGCDHSIFTCRDTFANVPNFGGQPQRPTKNPFTPTGFGVVEQT